MFAPSYYAFTLIELLVVIGIIGILAGLILPALAKSKDRARSIHCLNNEKQIGVEIDLYVQDYSYYPPGHQEPGWQWDLSLASYGGFLVNKSSPAAARLFLCPSAKIINTEERLNFSANPNVCKELKQNIGPAGSDSLQRPVDCIVVADAIQYSASGDSQAILWGVIGSGGTAVYWNDGLAANADSRVQPGPDVDRVLDATNPNGSNFRFRHGAEYANAWFADSHAAPLAKGHIRDRNLYTNY